MQSNQNLPIIILAAGESSRMFPFNLSGHKSLIKSAGSSLLFRTVEQLLNQNFSNLYLVIKASDKENPSFLEFKKQIENRFSNFELRLVYQAEALGMGDALLTVKAQYQELAQQPQFVVIGPYGLNIGDSINLLVQSIKANALESRKYQETNNTSQTLVSHSQTDIRLNTHAVLASQTKEPWLYGVLEFQENQTQKDSQSQRVFAKVSQIIEKPAPGQEPSNYKVQLLYLLNQSFWHILESVPAEEYSFESALNLAIKNETVLAVKTDTALPSLKYSWHLLKINKMILESALQTKIDDKAKIAKTAVLDDSTGKIIIEANAVVGDFVKIVGPAYIGHHSHIGEYSFIRNSIIESRVSIGANTEVVRSQVFSGSSIHQSYLADSIIGKNCKIGAGFISANKRLDRKLIKTVVKGKTVLTQLDRLGCVMGNESSLGIGVKTMPGVILPPQSKILPGTIIWKNTSDSSTFSS
jgi:UDP-N-acetylglucosamine diphosphorylase / glucose-1-phosphate thymidylyltransferase / UDP-N-acetylgalactosamine diphosphorylase / glucosamine-1-phosphate N-acetyltransferase / galactosamine-1-phosphate N-acetyltransferase